LAAGFKDARECPNLLDAIRRDERIGRNWPESIAIGVLSPERRRSVRPANVEDLVERVGDDKSRQPTVEGRRIGGSHLVGAGGWKIPELVPGL
ncbi:MAG: hypothetical protein OXH79_23340, partial [Boseongicola sp.]|nr:hypothetical protein [Boseongicola sp.]